MAARRCSVFLALLFFASLHRAFPHVIPDDVTVQAFVKPEGDRLHLLVRVPFNALADIIFPSRPDGELDLAQTEAMLPDAAKTWLSDWIDLYQDGRLLPKPRIAETRVSLASDNSFVSYEEAWEHVTGPRLPASVEVLPNQALFDVLFEYPIQPNQSALAIHSRLSRLGVRVVTALRFVSPNGAIRTFSYLGDPGIYQLDPGWRQAVLRFVPLGFLQIWKGSDYLLFLFCVALLFRRFRALIPFIVAFTLAHSITLIASAYNLAPDAIWFPVLFETLIALSVVYLAIENIVEGASARNRCTIACAFGLIFGFGFAFSLRQALQFGGSHRLASILSFNLGIELAQILALLAFVPLLQLLFGLGIPERIGTIFLAALAAHTGWHRMLDRAKWLRSAQFQWPAFDPVVLAATLRWLVIASVLGVTAYLVFRVLRPRHSAKPVP